MTLVHLHGALVRRKAGTRVRAANDACGFQVRRIDYTRLAQKGISSALRLNRLIENINRESMLLKAGNLTQRNAKTNSLYRIGRKGQKAFN